MVERTGGRRRVNEGFWIKRQSGEMRVDGGSWGKGSVFGVKTVKGIFDNF